MSGVPRIAQINALVKYRSGLNRVIEHIQISTPNGIANNSVAPKINAVCVKPLLSDDKTAVNEDVFISRVIIRQGDIFRRF